MHQILKSVIESFNLEIHSIMSGRGRRGRSRTSAPEAPPERYVEHTLRSEDVSMHQPPAEPSPKGRYLDDGSGYIDCYNSYLSATGVFRRTEGHDRTRSKLGDKTYDGTGDPEAGYLWLDRVSVLAIIW